MSATMSRLHFANQESEELYLLREHALLSISPFNSYYSEENLKMLFSWGLSEFKKINIFVPDTISVYTLQAIGYPVEKAKRKARLHDNSLKNKTIRALLANNLSECEAKGMLVCCSDLVHNEKYLEFHDVYKKLYQDNSGFREGCLETSKRVLASKDISKNVSNDEAACTAVKYFLAELPLQLNAHEILNISSSLYVYKDFPSDFLMDVYNKGNPFSSYVSPRQGYIAVDLVQF